MDEKKEELFEEVQNFENDEQKKEQEDCKDEESAENKDNKDQTKEGETDTIKSQLEEKTKLCEDYLNRMMRLQADFENYKRRVSKEREDMYTFALESIVMGILPVLDNLERAVDSFKSDNLDKKYVDGIDMVKKQLVEVLQKNGLSEIECEDKDFDPNFHHAVMQCEAEENDENKIKQVLQKGYCLGSKVIRPSLVKVATKN